MSRERATPLYRSVYEQLVERIADGRLAASGQLPPERSLCRDLGVSRATLRKALAELAADDLIDRVQGRGTFTARPRLAEPTNALLSFSRLAAANGLEPSAVVITASDRPSTISESELFRIAPGVPVFELERVRLLDGVPVALGRSVVPLLYAPSLTALDWRSASLYEVLTAAGHAPTQATHAIEAQAADDASALLLSLSTGAPVLVTESTSIDAAGHCVEQARMVYRGDRYRFQSTLTAPPVLRLPVGVDVRPASGEEPMVNAWEAPARVLAVG